MFSVLILLPHSFLPSVPYHRQHVQWVRAFTGGIQELQNYVKSNHTTGLVWNKEVCLCGEDVSYPLLLPYR